MSDRRHARVSATTAGFIAGLLIVLIVGTMIRINVDYGAPWASSHKLTLDFQAVDALSNGSDVRIAGRDAGQVTDVTAAGDHAVVTVSIDSSDWPIPVDTTASIRLATLLGQKYVELDLGTSHTMLADNATVSVAATAPVVDFDQVLDTFDAPTRDALTKVVRTLGDPATGALTGTQETLQETIGHLSNLSVVSVPATTVLATDDSDLNGILANLATTSDALALSSSDLASAIRNLNTVTAALAANPGAVESFIANSDAVDQTTNAVLGSGGAQQLASAIKQLPALATQANTLMAKLIPETAHFQNTAYTSSLDLIAEIGDATSQSDANGYFLRQNVSGVDITGLTPTSALTKASTNSKVPTVPSTPTLPSSPTVPTLPPLPTLPALPSLPPICLPTVVHPTAAPHPTATPKPGTTAACPTGTSSKPLPVPPICILGICLTSDTVTTAEMAPPHIDEFAWMGGIA